MAQDPCLGPMPAGKLSFLQVKEAMCSVVKLALTEGPSSGSLASLHTPLGRKEKLAGLKLLSGS